MLPRFFGGQEMTRDMLAEVVRLALREVYTVEPPLEIQVHGSGSYIRLNEEDLLAALNLQGTETQQPPPAVSEVIYAQILNRDGNGAYAWRQQDPMAGGDFTLTPSGKLGTFTTEPAYEESDNRGVPMVTTMRMLASDSVGNNLGRDPRGGATSDVQQDRLRTNTGRFWIFQHCCVQFNLVRPADLGQTDPTVTAPVHVEYAADAYDHGDGADGATGGGMGG